MNSDLNEPLISRNNNEDRKDNDQNQDNHINDSQSDDSMSDRLQSFFDFDNARNINWNKIEIGISGVGLLTLVPFYLLYKDDKFYQAELKDSYVIYIAYILIVRLPGLLQVLHFLHTYKHCSDEIDGVGIIIDMIYFFIFILQQSVCQQSGQLFGGSRLHLGDHIMSGYNLMTLPLSFAIILFYLTTVRGFLMFLIFGVFKPINGIVTPIFEWLEKKQIQELTSVSYKEAIRYLSVRSSDDYEGAIGLDTLDEATDGAVLGCQSRHIFHFEGMKAWMNSRMGGPMDREEISTGRINLIHRQIKNSK